MDINSENKHNIQNVENKLFQDTNFTCFVEQNHINKISNELKNIPEKKERKYNSNYRKKLITKFDNIKNKTMLIDIYNIIINDISTNFSSNRNGIFINMNILSDTCIDQLLKYLNDNMNYLFLDSSAEKVDCKLYKFDEIELLSEIGHKLSNQEKNIIKRIRNKN
jgi:hypothetical protein